MLCGLATLKRQWMGYLAWSFSSFHLVSGFSPLLVSWQHGLYHRQPEVNKERMKEILSTEWLCYNLLTYNTHTHIIYIYFVCVSCARLSLRQYTASLLDLGLGSDLASLLACFSKAIVLWTCWGVLGHCITFNVYRVSVDAQTFLYDPEEFVPLNDSKLAWPSCSKAGPNHDVSSSILYGLGSWTPEAFLMRGTHHSTGSRGLGLIFLGQN